MALRPRDPQDYGWVPMYPETRLVPTNSGLPNKPESKAHRRNLSRLSDFLGKLPFSLGVNSGFRTPAVNAAVGGASSSQHMNGLAADVRLIVPPGFSNRDLATYLYRYRDRLPELDQVIWYEATSHVHIGICPAGGTGCHPSARPGAGRQQFMVRRATGAYADWVPSTSDWEAAKWLIAAGPPRNWKLIGRIFFGLSLAVALGGVGWAWRRTAGHATLR